MFEIDAGRFAYFPLEDQLECTGTRIEFLQLQTGHFRTSIAMVTARKKRSTEQDDDFDEPELTAAQSKVLASLIAGRNYLEAAADGGVTDRTVRRWRESCPAFELALREQIQNVRDAASITASLASQTAVKTLVEIASKPDHPLVLRAIQMLFDLSGPLPQQKAPTSVNDIEEEHIQAMLKRISSRG